MRLSIMKNQLQIQHHQYRRYFSKKGGCSACKVTLLCLHRQSYTWSSASCGESRLWMKTAKWVRKTCPSVAGWERSRNLPRGERHLRKPWRVGGIQRTRDNPFQEERLRGAGGAGVGRGKVTNAWVAGLWLIMRLSKWLRLRAWVPSWYSSSSRPDSGFHRWSQGWL